MTYVAHAITAASADLASPERGMARLLPEPARTLQLEARFWAKVSKSPGCWEWTACKSPAGYGRFIVKDRSYPAHRIARWLATGEWPGELFTCHVCDNPGCCNPDHLFLGTPADNMRDMSRKGRAGAQRHPELFTRNIAHASALARAKTHCIRGHEYSPETTRISPDGWRRCPVCERLWSRERNARRRAVAGLGPYIPTSDRTHCPYGHEYSSENTKVDPRTGGRGCVECHRRRQREYVARRRAAPSPGSRTWSARS
jgi:hypothetical protein